MSELDFVVKNGLQVNNGLWVVNSAGIYYNSAQWANSTFLNQRANSAITANSANTANTANNANNLGGVAPTSYVNTSGNYTISGNLNFTASNNQFLTIRLGANVLGNSTGFYTNGQLLGSGGGYFKGNDGTIGDVNNKNNLYRVNSNTQSNNITIAAGENALTVGPIVIQDGFNLTVQSGGRAVIV
jgi:hypothetical protein